MRRPSRLVRASRALVGLITLWCLGCSSYEPLLDSLIGGKARAMMTCDTDMTAPAASHAPAASEPDHTASAISASPDDRGFDCGCGGSCHAPSPAFATIAVPRSPIAAVDQPQPSEPLSIARTPLLPPPEFTA
jgi:hypothetical protein